jgi:predicted O-linked N-acetylglucosamine transferase (SPINDLY family)
VFYTFEPSPESPPVNGLPALAGQPFTFACMNYPSKINDRVIALWARILAALPEARLMIGNVGSNRYTLRLMSAFASHNIGAERLLLVPRKPIGEFLAVHHRMDLALDPFPFAGLTMSLHHLWMGVPILTLEGRTAASRQGVTVMNGVGWPEFIAKDHDDYVEKAVFWARHPERLNEVRQSLRERFTAALIRNDESSVVQNVEAAYRDMWTTWVNGNPP